MMDNFELICENYNPAEKINWVSIDNDNKKKGMFLAVLYNRDKKDKKYFLTLFLLADEPKEKFTLKVRGNLNNWFTQKRLGRNLTLDDYKECFYLLFSEIDIKENVFLNARVKNADIKLNVALRTNFINKKL